MQHITHTLIRTYLSVSQNLYKVNKRSSVSVCLSECRIFDASSLNLAQKVGGPADNQTTVKPSASYSQCDRQNTVDTVVTASNTTMPVTT